jgi:hypothetical protein
MAAHEFEVRWPTSEERQTYLEYLEYMDALRAFKRDMKKDLQDLREAVEEFNAIWK